MILTAAFLCLALNVYNEARGETLEGQLAVAMTTMNRAAYKSDHICEVVMAPRQFSWTNTSVKRTKNGWKILSRALPRDREAWREARAVATVAMKGKVLDFTGGATFYHTKVVHPAWDRGMRKVYVAGNHIFYAN